MNLNPTIQTLSGEQLNFQIARPLEYKGIIIPGFITRLARGIFGSFFIQEYRDENYLLHYCVVESTKHVALRIRSTGNDLFTRMSIQGDLLHKTDNRQHFKLQQGEFTKLPIAASGIVNEYEAGKQYIFTDIYFSAKLVKEALSLFPEMDLDRISVRGKRVNENIRQAIDSILHCQYIGELRRHFFNSRVKDLLIEYLVQWSMVEPDAGGITAREIEAAHKAERIISADISLHYTIPELARMVHLSENRFKVVYKKIFGTGAYEYLMQLRLKKARQLIEQGYSVKEVAAETGYHVSHFINVYRDFFGETPGMVRKRRKQ